MKVEKAGLGETFDGADVVIKLTWDEASDVAYALVFASILEDLSQALDQLFWERRSE